MDIIFILLPLTLLLAGLGVAGFIWAAKRGQLDDLDTPARRILVDDVEVNRVSRAGRPAGGTEPSSRM